MFRPDPEGLRFPRVSRDDPMRSRAAIYGPYLNQNARTGWRWNDLAIVALVLIAIACGALSS